MEKIKSFGAEAHPIRIEKQITDFYKENYGLPLYRLAQDN